MLHTHKDAIFYAEPNENGTTELWGYGEHTTYPEPYCEVVREYASDAQAFAELVCDWLCDAELLTVVDGDYVTQAQADEDARESAWIADDIHAHRSTYFTRSNLL